MPIWDKGYDVEKAAIYFSVGDDHIYDQQLIKYDIQGSRAHAQMLHKIGILNDQELKDLEQGLTEISKEVENNNFPIVIEDEDCHSAIEKYLTNKFGEVGKKIHTGRSRNDQVITALRLLEKDQLNGIMELCRDLLQSLQQIIQKYGEVDFPGYTHMRKAMPATVQLWLESFSAALDDDIAVLEATKDIIDQNPLGTAAGFGVPEIKLDREMTTQKLGFRKLLKNPMYAQITRGKFEGNIINACAQVMLTLNKISSDLILFSMTEFSLIKIPREFCTGSSIMPQKVNPDVLELIRGKYHQVLGKEFEVKSLVGNLMSGYNRDVQLTKKSVMDALSITLESLAVLSPLVKNLEVDSKACAQAMTKELYATEKVNRLVVQGESFRTAYQKVAKEFI